MLHVILVILKILLWIVLGILGLALLLILLVLFAPIRYRVEAEYQKTAKVCARLRFLIVSVKLTFNQEKKELNQVIRVLGIRIGSGREKTVGAEKDSSDEEERAETSVGSSAKTESISKQLESSEQIRDTVTDIVREESEVSEAISEPSDTSAHEEYDLWNNEEYEDAVPEEERKLFGRLKAFLTLLWTKLKAIYDRMMRYTPGRIYDRVEEKTKKIKQQTERLGSFLNLSCTVKTRAYLKKYLVGLLKHIGPRRIKGYVHYGFGEPCKTGQITGYLSLMPFVYQKGFSLEPDFYEKVIEGKIYMRGRIHLGYILRIILNINIWRTIKVARGLLNK